MDAPHDPIKSIKHPAIAAARKGTGPGGPSFVVDGRSLVSQALAAGAEVERLFFLHPVEDGEAALLVRAQVAGIESHLVSKGVFFKVLGLGYETSVRVLAQVARPRPAGLTAGVDGDTCLLVGERIQDPRNVGVLVRTVDGWAGCRAVFSADSADPWSRAGVRSSTGSIFRVPPATAANLPRCLDQLKAEGVRVIGTSAGADMPCWEADLTGPCALALGNESVGLSPGTADVCDSLVTIPMSGGAHSFNITVAAGILLYERARQTARRRCQ